MASLKPFKDIKTIKKVSKNVNNPEESSMVFKNVQTISISNCIKIKEPSDSSTTKLTLVKSSSYPKEQPVIKFQKQPFKLVQINGSNN